MLAGLKALIWPRPVEIAWVVDHDQEPSLPNGARRVIRHIPIGKGTRTIEPGDLEIVEFRSSMTYDKFYKSNMDRPLCDVLFLDSLIRKMVENKSQIDSILQKYFGNFRGQIFFLGTEFESFDGRPCVPYLNIKTYQPALRYLCPSAHPINHDVVCCAAFYRKDVISGHLLQ